MPVYQVRYAIMKLILSDKIKNNINPDMVGNASRYQTIH